MSSHTDRKADGARDTVALLDSLIRNDFAGANAIVNHCDTQPTVLALASAWIALADMQGLDKAALIASMRKAMDGAQ